MRFLNKNNIIVFWPLAVLSFIILGLGIYVLINIKILENLNEGQIMIASIFGSFLVSTLVLFITLNNEKRSEYVKAKKSAKVLSQLLGSISQQVKLVQNGSNQSIIYPGNWLDFYLDCTLYLEYDYLNTLLIYFNLIEEINNSQKLNTKKEIIDRIIDTMYFNSSLDFNIYEIQVNLILFSNEKSEMIIWKESKSYKKFSREFQSKYTKYIINYTLSYLRKYGNAPSLVVREYLIKNLKDLKSFQRFIDEHKGFTDREIRNVIFEIFVNPKNQKKYELVWGKLSLKD